jgi:hypothetical protein
MIRTFRKGEDGRGTWIALIAAVFWLLGVLMYDAFGRYYLSQRPFADVQLVSAHPVGESTEIIATYEKLGCTIQRMVVYGLAFGNYTALDYRPRRGPNEDFERIEGRQTMDIIVETRGVRYEAIEIRTRHDCDGERVDSIFLRAEL